MRSSLIWTTIIVLAVTQRKLSLRAPWGVFDPRKNKFSKIMLKIVIVT